MQKQLTENVLILDKNMATTFRTKIVKDVGTQKIEAFETAPEPAATIIGMNLANTSLVCKQVF